MQIAACMPAVVFFTGNPGKGSSGNGSGKPKIKEGLLEELTIRTQLTGGRQSAGDQIDLRQGVGITTKQSWFRDFIDSFKSTDTPDIDGVDEEE